MNKNETIADIRKEAEARFRELLEKHVDSLGRIQAMQQFNQVFDRIEAAVKRERVEVSVHAGTSAINLTEEKWNGESGLRESVELCDKIINDGTIVCNCDIVHEARAKIRAALALFTNSPENENSGTDNVTPVNNEACRNALEEILEKIDKWRTDNVMEHWQYSQIFDIANWAIAEPARNCDRYATHDKAAEAFTRLKELPEMLPDGNGVELLREWLYSFIEWLFIENKKGESDGSK